MQPSRGPRIASDGEPGESASEQDSPARLFRPAAADAAVGRSCGWRVERRLVLLRGELLVNANHCARTLARWSLLTPDFLLLADAGHRGDGPGSDEALVVPGVRVHLASARLRRAGLGDRRLLQLDCGGHVLLISARGAEQFEQWSAALAPLTLHGDFGRRFKLLSKLGQGSSAPVFKALNLRTQALCAVKVFDKRACCPRAVRNEVRVMRHANGHPGVVQLHEVHEDRRHVRLVMELLEGGDVSERGFCEQPEALRAVLRHVLAALVHLARRRIVHRDLKPQNLLLAAPPSARAPPAVKIIDFGLAALLDDPDPPFRTCGTPGYVAPEIFDSARAGLAAANADVFSLGVVAYNALTRSHAFRGPTLPLTLAANQRAALDWAHPRLLLAPAPLRALLRAMLDPDPRRRLPAAAALQSPCLAPARPPSRAPPADAAEPPRPSALPPLGIKRTASDPWTSASSDRESLPAPPGRDWRRRSTLCDSARRWPPPLDAAARPGGCAPRFSHYN